MVNGQQELWYDSFEDALRSTAEAVGMKKMAAELWPEKSLNDAVRMLLHCLDPDRAEKLSGSQTALIIERGRSVNCLVALAYLCRRADCADPQPVDPEDEKARLAREFIEAVDLQSKLIKRLEALRT